MTIVSEVICHQSRGLTRLSLWMSFSWTFPYPHCIHRLWDELHSDQLNWSEQFSTGIKAWPSGASGKQTFNNQSKKCKSGFIEFCREKEAFKPCCQFRWGCQIDPSSILAVRLFSSHLNIPVPKLRADLKHTCRLLCACEGTRCTWLTSVSRLGRK